MADSVHSAATQAERVHSGSVGANAPLAEGSVDWLGAALELEAEAKRVGSQTAERAMLAAAHRLRLMGEALRDAQNEAYAEGRKDEAEARGWISVGERMPEPGTECLVYGPHWLASAPYVRIDCWDEQREAPVGFSSATVPVGPGWGDAAFDEVTHWMPLPEPPSSSADTPACPL